MAGKAIPTVAEIVLGQGLLTLNAEQANGMPVAEFNKAGVVLLNERSKAYMAGPDGKAVEFTVSLYIQRAAVSDDEQDQVNAVKADRDGKAAARKQEEQDRLAREKRAAFELGQESTFGALRNLETLQSAAHTLNKLR